ncbi:MAG: HEAT repeat domain-containing protein [Planctomycetes bacterium]|nr:HEAT repeat domain-containing protein [Planctomycetota bacterium]
MKTVQLIISGAGLLAMLAMLAWPASRLEAHGRGFVSVGVNVGPPCGRWGGCGGWGCGPWGGCGWYRPFPAVYYGVYLPPPPPRVIVQPIVQPVVQPAPVVLQQAPISAAPPVSEPSPPPRPVAPAVTSASVVSRGDGGATIDEHLSNLADPDEGMRQNAVLELGRANAARAIDPLAATLAGDASPAVREAAARALGLIASPRALPALTRAAQADADRDVRRSAQFAVEIIHNRMKQR